jgi:hypothetical protein
MVNDCLKGYIGLAAADDAQSGLYAAALPGISVFNIGKITDNSESQSVASVFSDCEDRAIQTFMGAFAAAINERYCIADIEAIQTLMCANKSRVAVSLWYFIGHELMVERMASDRLNRYTTIDLKKAKELREFYMERAKWELDNAVKSIAMLEDSPEKDLVMMALPII